jgi:hypothetical protein
MIRLNIKIVQNTYPLKAVFMHFFQFQTQIKPNSAENKTTFEPASSIQQKTQNKITQKTIKK